MWLSNHSSVHVSYLLVRVTWLAHYSLFILMTLIIASLNNLQFRYYHAVIDRNYLSDDKAVLIISSLYQRVTTKLINYPNARHIQSVHDFSARNMSVKRQTLHRSISTFSIFSLLITTLFFHLYTSSFLPYICFNIETKSKALHTVQTWFVPTLHTFPTFLFITANSFE